MSYAVTIQTIASESICIQRVPCLTAAGVGAVGVHAVMGTVVNLQCTLINIYMTFKVCNTILFNLSCILQPVMQTCAAKSIDGKAIAGIAGANVRTIRVGAQVLATTAVITALVDVCIQEMSSHDAMYTASVK